MAISKVARNSRLKAILCARSSSRHFGTPIEHPVCACVYVFICCCCCVLICFMLLLFYSRYLVKVRIVSSGMIAEFNI
jgi:hypothetical protein